MEWSGELVETEKQKWGREEIRKGSKKSFARRGVNKSDEREKNGL